MGQGDNPGVLPRFCEELFERVEVWSEVWLIFEEVTAELLYITGYCSQWETFSRVRDCQEILILIKEIYWRTSIEQMGEQQSVRKTERQRQRQTETDSQRDRQRQIYRENRTLKQLQFRPLHFTRSLMLKESVPPYKRCTGKCCWPPFHQFPTLQ